TKVIARCYAKMALVNSDEPVITSYEELISDTKDETNNNLNNLLPNVVNKVLVIDDLPAFDDGMSYSPGLEMIDSIVKAYKEANGAIILVATGEKEKVKELLSKKKAFKSLFTNPMIEVGEYTEPELRALINNITMDMGYILEPAAEDILVKEYNAEKGKPDFRALNMFEGRISAAINNMATRIASIRHPKEMDQTLIRAEDFRDKSNKKDDGKTIEELLAELNSLIGLSAVKKEVNTLIDGLKVAKLEREAGIKESTETMHMIFAGSPGTGKTTVARLIGQIYAKLGVLSKGQMIECSRQDLVSEFVGGTAKQVHAKVMEAYGGVLFIDEAYSVCRDEYDTYGREAVDTLTADIYNYRDDLLVILAGYDNEMDEFLSKNPGMKSRIPNKIHFDDYDIDELMQIMTKYVQDTGMQMEFGLESKIKSLLEEKSRTADFGNARGVENVFTKIKKNHRSRIANLEGEVPSEEIVKTITAEDLFDSGEEVKKEKTAKESFDELNSLTGLSNVKKQVKSIADMLAVIKAKKERGLPAGDLPALHMVFKGGPGTGKTTVARLIGEIYKGLGILPTGKFVECTRSDVVGEYMGQTAKRMDKKINEALGGVLFIDEAYSLCNGPNDEYGREAINQLVPAMENYRDSLMVIVAGYTDEMDDFLASNEGLKSRFANEIVFEDYTVDELITIFNDMVKGKHLQLSTEEGLDELISSIIEKASKAPDFGNARGVRKLVEKLEQIQNGRIAPMIGDGDEISDDMIVTVNKDDLMMLITKI
ncbi:MAG: AAA family ATPase, partial [Lachnospiraceae bacterium]|nr:AAA family ATPase [Lachnospiraceae bacterium]